MPTIDPNHCWLVLIETPDGGKSAAMMPAETFDIEAVLDLRAQIGEEAVISLMSDETIAYCESIGDLKARLESWVEITLADPESDQDEAEDDMTCGSMLCSQATCSGCPLDEVTP
jgi:hypothetical protein